MPLRWNPLNERLLTSLFFVPMMGVVTAILFAAAALALDRQLDDAADLPLALASTVESARAVLSTIASATITFAGIAFSISLLVVQQASNQYSPRIVHTLFRDPFNKRVMGLVIGTFTYCLVVLRSVRAPVEPSGDPVIPNLSVAVAVALGVITILAVVAFINHSAHSMGLSAILDRARREASTTIEREWGHDCDEPEPDGGSSEDAGWPVRFERSGWVQHIDTDELITCIPDRGTIVLDTHPGRYAVRHTVLCTVSGPAPDEEAERAIQSTVTVGDSRTMQQDPSYALRELADVALRALSPGINDPTTAQDAIFHAAAVLLELLEGVPPPRVREGPNRRRLVLGEQPTQRDLIGLAYDEVRQAAATQPAVCIYLLESLALLVDALGDAHPEPAELLREQARLVVAGCERSDSLPADIARVRGAYTKRFDASG